MEQGPLVSCMDENTFPIFRHGSIQAYPAQGASLFLRVCLLLLICEQKGTSWDENNQIMLIPYAPSLQPSLRS